MKCVKTKSHPQETSVREDEMGGGSHSRDENGRFRPAIKRIVHSRGEEGGYCPAT